MRALYIPEQHVSSKVDTLGCIMHYELMNVVVVVVACVLRTVRGVFAQTLASINISKSFIVYLSDVTSNLFKLF